MIEKPNYLIVLGAIIQPECLIRIAKTLVLIIITLFRDSKFNTEYI